MVRSIGDEDIGHFLGKKCEQEPILKAGTKVFERPYNPDSPRDDLENTIFSFVLNMLAAKDGLMIGDTFIMNMSTAGRMSFKELKAFSNAPPVSVSSKAHYKLNSRFKTREIQAIYDLLFVASERSPILQLSMDRLYSSKLRKLLQDRVLDLTVSLEAMIGSSQEVSHKFSLFNALLNSDDFNERKKAYNLLSRLYLARSKLVHGASIDAVDFTDDQFRELERIAVQSIISKARFINSLPDDANVEGRWKKYQTDLALI